jgi:hypothetical protein
MTHVYLALLKVSKSTFGKQANNRAQEFAMAVQQAKAALALLDNQNDGVRVFVAPEYFWSVHDDIGQSARKTEGPLTMKRSAKHDIYKSLKTISRQAGNLVIVAGSIFYRKFRLTSPSEALNVCPVLQNGDFLLKAYKQMDDGFAKRNDGDLEYKFKDNAPYFAAGGVNFGLEICGEHFTLNTGVQRRLKTWVETSRQSIDIQIVVSEGVVIKAESVVAKNAGYVAQCDFAGNAVAVGVYNAAGPFNINNAVPPNSVTGAQINGGQINCYKLTV